MIENKIGKTLAELAQLIGGDVHGDPNAMITGVADIADAAPGDIVFAESPRYLEAAAKSPASAIIVPEGVDNSDKPLIRVGNPRYAYARVLEVFAPADVPEPGIHPSCSVASDASIGENVSAGHNAYIGHGSVIGDGSIIHPFAYIGNDVNIGENCVIHPFAAVLHGVQLGNRVIVHSGSVIGADGFGYTRVGDRHYKIPQIGTVVIHDDVEIGANATIDRARTGVTEIGRGTKIDNLVHIAHNCTVGENCAIMALTGVSGSVVIGNQVMITGQGGVKDNVTVGDNAICAGRAGVIGNIPPGSFVSGYPAVPHAEQMRGYAAMHKLPDLIKRVRELEKQLRALQKDSE